MLKIIKTKQFKKDLKKIQNNKKVLSKLWIVINKISKLEVLDEWYKDHKLKWDFSEFRECHIEPDFLLIYKVEKDELLLVLARTWSHSELF